MKSELKKTKYIKIFFDDNSLIYSWEFLAKSEDMSVQEIRDTFHLMMKMMKECQPKLVIADDRKNLGLFQVELQEWIARITSETLMACEVKKFAIVRPEDYVNGLATEQAVDEAKTISKGIQIEMFADIRQAENWVIE